MVTRPALQPRIAHPLADRQWVSLAPVFCALLLYVVYDVVKRVSGVESTDPFAGITLGDIQDEALREAFLRKLTWGVTTLAYVVAWLVAVVVNFSVICRVASSPDQAGRELPWMWPTGGVIAIALGLLMGYGDAISVGKVTDFVQDAVTRLQIGSSNLWLHLPLGLGLSILMLMLWSATAVLWSSQTTSVRDLEMRTRGMRLILYAGGAVLVTAVFNSHALHMLASPLLSASGVRNEVTLLEGVANAVTTAQGALWTLALLAVYSPVALILHRRACNLARELVAQRLSHNKADTVTPAAMKNEKEKEPIEVEREWLKSNALDTSPGQQLSAWFAALAPLIGGSALVDVLKLI